MPQADNSAASGGADGWELQLRAARQSAANAALRLVPCSQWRPSGSARLRGGRGGGGDQARGFPSAVN